NPRHHRITLSALASTFGGIVRPICFAAFNLIMNSNFIGCSIGKRERRSSASSPAPPRRSESPGSLEFDTPRTADRPPRRPSPSALALPCRGPRAPASPAPPPDREAPLVAWHADCDAKPDPWVLRPSSRPEHSWRHPLHASAASFEWLRFCCLRE